MRHETTLSIDACRQSCTSTLSCAAFVRRRFFALLLLLLCWCWSSSSGSVAAAASQFTPPSVLKIAYFGALTLPSGSSLRSSLQFGQPGLQSFMLAIDAINNASEAWRADGTMPGAPFYLPVLRNTTLEAVSYDTQSDPGLAVNAAFDAAASGVVAFVGGWMSATSKQIQYVAARAQVPQISPGATSVSFTTQHDSSFPYFMRNVPSVGCEARQLALLLRNHFGWSRAAVVHSSEEIGTGATAQLIATGMTIDFNILVDINYNAGTPDFSYQIQQLVSSQACIIIYVGLPDDLRTLWRAIKAGAAAKMNPDLLGDGYQWIHSHSTTDGELEFDDSGNIIPDIAEMMPGMIGLKYYINSSSEQFNQLQELIDTSAADWNVTSTITTDTNAAGYVWDAVQQIALGAAYLLDREIDPRLMENRAVFYESIRNRTLVGTTGNIILTPAGDRLIGFDVVNFQRAANKFVTVGAIDPSGKFIALDGADPMEFQGSQPYVQPSDIPARTILKIPLHVTIIIIAVSCCVILAFGCVQCAVVAYRERSVIKASSPIFLITCLIGVQMMCASLMMRSLESRIDLSPYQCWTDTWLMNLGYVFLAGSLLVKTYRLQAIFNMRRRHDTKVVSDRQLLFLLSLVVVGEAATVLSLQIVAPLSLRLVQYDNSSDFYACTVAGSGSKGIGSFNALYLPVLATVRFSLLLVTAIMAFRVRHMPDMYNECRQLLGTVYNLMFASAMLPVIDRTLRRGTEVNVISYAVVVYFICIVSVGVLFLPKAYALWKENQPKLPQGTTIGMFTTANMHRSVAGDEPVEKDAGKGDAEAVRLAQLHIDLAQCAHRRPPTQMQVAPNHSMPCVSLAPPPDPLNCYALSESPIDDSPAVVRSMPLSRDLIHRDCSPSDSTESPADWPTTPPSRQVRIVVDELADTQPIYVPREESGLATPAWPLGAVNDGLAARRPRTFLMSERLLMEFMRFNTRTTATAHRVPHTTSHRLLPRAPSSTVDDSTRVVTPLSPVPASIASTARTPTGPTDNSSLQAATRGNNAHAHTRSL